jgi:outer membrane protein assembly factor BamB
MRKSLSLLSLLLLSMLAMAACGTVSPATTQNVTPTPSGPPDSSLGIYFGGQFSADGTPANFYALNASDGKLAWKTTVSPDSLLETRAANGVVFVTEKNGVSALRSDDGKQLWHQDVGRATVDAVADGVVYGTAFNGTDTVVTTIYALSASDGQLLWQSNQPGGYVEQVVNGAVYVGFAPMASPGAFGLSALKASDGSLIWHYDVQEEVQLQNIVNGQAYVNVSEPPNSVSDIPPGFLAALDVQTGKELWRYDPGNGGSAGAIASDTQQVYVVSINTQQGQPSLAFYGLNPSDGSVKWHAQGDESTYSSYALDKGTLYAGSPDGTITALNTSDGSTKWHMQIPVTTDGTAQVVVQVADGLLYVSSTDQGVYVLNASDGSAKWHAQIAGYLGVVAMTSSSLYVNASTDANGTITALNLNDGSTRWTYTASDVDAGTATLG